MVRRVNIRIAVIVLLVLIAIPYLLVKGRVSTDLSVFLPTANNQEQAFLLRQLGSGVSSSLIFIDLNGADADTLAAYSETFTEALMHTGLFRRVANKSETFGQAQLDYLVEHRYQLSHDNLQEKFTVEGFQQALEERLKAIASASYDLEKQLLRRDPTGEVMGLINQWLGKLSRYQKPETVNGVWFTSDHRSAVLLAEIKSNSGFELKQQEVAVAALEEIFDSTHPEGVKMIITGPAAFAVEIAENIRSDARILSFIGVTLVVFFLMLVYRSAPIVVYIITPLAVGVLIASALVMFLYGEIHGITLAFGVTLAGVAVDYPIHILTGIEPDREASREHVKKIWRTLRIGVLSTAIAYGAFLISDFGGLQQLGVFTVTGLVVASYFSRWVLPSIVQRFYLEARGLMRFHEWLKWVGQALPRHRYVVVVCMLVSLSYLFLTDREIIRYDVESLSPIADDRKQQDRQVRKALGFWTGGNLLVVQGKDKEAVLREQEALSQALDKLVNEQLITGFDMAGQFLPSQTLQQQNLSVFADRATIEADFSRSLEGLPFKAQVFEPFLQDLALWQHKKPLTADALLSSEIGKRLEAMLFDFNDQAAGIVLLHGVEDENQPALKAFAAQREGLLFIHMKSEATNLVAAGIRTTALTMLGSILALYLILTVSFKSFARPLKIMVPTFSAALVAAAALVALGASMTVFHMVSLLLVIGLGLDYALFFNRLPDNRAEWDTTFKALWICGITTMLVFLMLTFSATPPLRAIGMTVSIGAFTSILFASMWAARPERRKKKQPE